MSLYRNRTKGWWRIVLGVFIVSMAWLALSEAMAAYKHPTPTKYIGMQCFTPEVGDTLKDKVNSAIDRNKKADKGKGNFELLHVELKEAYADIHVRIVSGKVYLIQRISRSGETCVKAYKELAQL